MIHIILDNQAASATYQQIGSDIEGEAEFDWFGSSVSMSADGTTLVVGATNNDGAYGANTGHVRVYKFDSTVKSYIQVGLDIDGEAAGDHFGRSVSMSADGTTFVVGAPSNNGRNGTDSGHVRVYKFNPTTDTYAQFGMDIDGEAARDWFGSSVSMSADGTSFVVGAIYNNGRNGTDSGHVRVYKFDSVINSYAQAGLDIDGEAKGDHFGGSVSMSADGTTFVVGAENNAGINGTSSGHVRVYKFNSTIRKYAQVGLDIDGEAAIDHFGYSVSMSGDGTTFVAGAIWNDGVAGRFGLSSGHVRVYKFDSFINSYAQVGLDIDGEGLFGDRSGWSVSMSDDGTTFVVGAPNNKGVNGTNSGHVRVYKFNSTINSYAQIGLDIDGEAASDRFGVSVSMSADGTTFAVGAQLNDGVNGVSSGHVRVYSIKRPNMVPTKSPTKQPTKQPTTVNCQVSWKLFNSQTDSFVANLSNGTTVSKAPPCIRTNIKALVPCGDSNNQVMLELYNATSLVQRYMERTLPYFLFGNNGGNIYNGRIAPGTYRIRAKVNDMFTPYTTFTLKGPACN